MTFLLSKSNFVFTFIGEVFMICRGTWFYEGAWGPVEEMLADRLEMEHLTHFRGHLLTSQRVDDTTKESKFRGY